MRQTPIFILTTLALVYCTIKVSAQSCAKESLTAKYWQYRENLNKHFVMSDRKPEGCIGNGITRVESDLLQINCGTELLHGYGTPATSIFQKPNGGVGGMPEGDFKDYNCTLAGPSPGYSWDTLKPVAHNFIEYGSETPHQLGYYLVTLATEYALLGKNGQIEEQQRTLEDIFLALQAFRRLDITANCLVKNRYDEITEGFEAENCILPVNNNITIVAPCLCSEKYHNGQCGPWSQWNFDTPCKKNCPWAPDLSGFSGFFIREDAVQEQEAMHDPSEDKWNIDLVSNAFAMSQTPPCLKNFSPACFNEKQTNFLSQDQIFPMLTGLAMVKHYIPPTATVTTCDGTVYNPFNIVQEIAKGLVELPQNSARHIFWPGSSDGNCCYKAVKFGECAGGNLQLTYAGVEYMYNYINEGNGDHKVGFLDRWKWGKSNGRRAFFAQAMSVGFDIGTYGSGIAKQRIINTCIDDKQEILLLMNDLLYPALPNIMDDAERADLKAMFEQMLCSAPCEGVCYKPTLYDTLPTNWPEFDCANTPDWIGQRWEGYGYPPPTQEDWNKRNENARQYNGLDFMALYNTYMLCFPEEQTPYYNPDRPESTTSGHLLGEGKIEGPSTLCPGTSGSYLLKKTNVEPTLLQAITWESSSNISLSSTSTNPTIATVNTGQTPSHIGVSFQERIEKQQYYNGVAQQTEGYYAYVGLPELQWVPPHNINIADICDFTYQKPILTELPDFTIVADVNPCTFLYTATISPTEVNGLPLPESAFTWTAVNNTNGWSSSQTGRLFDFGDVIPPPIRPCGTVTLTLHITTACGNIVKTKEVDCTPCPNLPQYHVIITPNPAGNQISIRVADNATQDFNSTDPNGVRIRIYPANGGFSTLMDSHLYSNGQMFGTSSIPNGLYTVVATASDLTPIQTSLAIIL